MSMFFLCTMTLYNNNNHHHHHPPPEEENGSKSAVQGLAVTERDGAVTHGPGCSQDTMYVIRWLLFILISRVLLTLLVLEMGVEGFFAAPVWYGIQGG